MYSPFDFNESMAQRKEYIEERLRHGSPVVGVAYDKGLLLLTVRRTQRKVYEIYDRQMFSAIGNQADIENIRLASVQMAHQEGFDRSPDDVSVQRLVGFSLSPSLKKGFGDQWTVPFVIRALFAEIGRSPGSDQFFTLNYDGEFRQHSGAACIAGTPDAESRMLEQIGTAESPPVREAALQTALRAWLTGARAVLEPSGATGADRDEITTEFGHVSDADFLRGELKSGALEVGTLERRGAGEWRFRLLGDLELTPLQASL